MQPFYSLSSYFKSRFGCRVRKIPLDAGSSCPNRDGSLSSRGCLFCDANGSGNGLWAQGLDLSAQWARLRARQRHGEKIAWLAYLQSFSNTYGPLTRLRNLLAQVARLPDMAGLCIGTRPDCLEREKLRLLAAQNIPEIWLDIGLQSCHDRTLTLINRGHRFADFVRSCTQAAELRLKICAHVIAGLPGEGPSDFLATVKALNDLPVAGIKFHNLYVSKASGLAALWRNGDYRPPELEEYLRDWLIPAVRLLRPDIVVHRLMADPPKDELLSPQWTQDKGYFLKRFNQLVGR